MTKAELQIDRDEWKQQAESLQDELDSLLDSLNENNCIYSLEDFIFRLKIDNLYSSELEKFIEDYKRFYNKKEE